MPFNFKKAVSSVASQATATFKQVSAETNSFINDASKQLSSGKFNSQLLGRNYWFFKIFDYEQNKRFRTSWSINS